MSPIPNLRNMFLQVTDKGNKNKTVSVHREWDSVYVQLEGLVNKTTSTF